VQEFAAYDSRVLRTGMSESPSFQRQCTDRIRADDTATIENFLKLNGRFGISVGGHKALAAKVG
jgi:hypothetical protein